MAVLNGTSNLCAEIQPQLAAYALGEREIDSEVQAHLETCPACRDDLLAYAQVARVLPYSTPNLAPPPSLRERIIADASKPVAIPSPAPQVTLPVSTRRRRRFSPAWVAFACAIIALIASLGWNVALQNTITTQTAQITTSREGWQTMIVLLNDPTVKWYAVNGDKAHGHVWAAPGGNVGCLVVQGLPPIAADQIYQVWLTHNGWQTSAGTFEEHNGNAWTLIRTDQALNDYTSIAITVGPRSGGGNPNGPNILQGSLSAGTEMDSAARDTWLRLLAQSVGQGS